MKESSMSRAEILKTIRGLGELFSDGFLTEEEFQREKNALLAQLRYVTMMENRATSVSSLHQISLEGLSAIRGTQSQMPPVLPDEISEKGSFTQRIERFIPTRKLDSYSESAELELEEEEDERSFSKEEVMERIKVKRVIKEADKGNPIAQCALGHMLREGHGMPPDADRAFELFLASATQGEPGAFFSVGMMYYNGEGVKRDYKEAFMWFQKAAEMGKANAQCLVGCMFHEGKGTRKDNMEAVKWLRKASMNGYKAADLLLKHILRHSKLTF
tara:strand:- start:2408 stop:3226 length:819 start_codon:yes stop_codon:yes gene_type:complete